MYQLTENGVIRLSDNAYIPADLGNRDYTDFIAWKAAGNEPLPIPMPSAEETRRGFLSANNAAYNAATMTLTADYPQLEKDTWPTQNEEASAWVIDPVGAATPWIDRAASERGVEREEYIRRTLIKARQFKAMSAFLTGRRQRYEDQIKAGGDPVLEYTLTPEVLAELQQITDIIMSTPAASLQEALA